MLKRPESSPAHQLGGPELSERTLEHESANLQKWVGNLLSHGQQADTKKTMLDYNTEKVGEVMAQLRSKSIKIKGMDSRMGRTLDRSRLTQEIKGMVKANSQDTPGMPVRFRKK